MDFFLIIVGNKLCMTALNTNTSDDDGWIEECGLHCIKMVRRHVSVIASSPLGKTKFKEMRTQMTNKEFCWSYPGFTSLIT